MAESNVHLVQDIVKYPKAKMVFVASEELKKKNYDYLHMAK
jgi:hypothetical protein